MMRRGGGADERRLLGEMLLEAGLVSRRGIDAALEEQRLRGGRLGYNLLKLGLVTPASLYLFLRDSLDVIDPDLLAILRTAPAVDLLPARLAHFYNIVPIRAHDGVLALGMAAADDAGLIPAIEALTGMRVDPVVCPPALISEALGRFYPSEVEPGVVYRPAGDNLFVLSDARRGLRPLIPEAVRNDAPASVWLRAIGAEAIRRGSRTLRLEPGGGILQAAFREGDDQERVLVLPGGAYAGVARLIDGLSRLGARGRIVPRDGRFRLRAEGRRLAVSVRALPGLAGDVYALDLRADAVAEPDAARLAAEMPRLPALLDRLVARRRGLVVVAGSRPPEKGAGLAGILALLRDRLGDRVAVGDWGAVLSPEGTNGADEEDLPFEALMAQATARSPQVVALGDLSRPERAAAALAQSGERVVVGSLRAPDACAAAAMLARAHPGLVEGRGAAGEAAAILSVRLMEGLCGECRRPYDVADVVPWSRDARAPAHGPYYAAQGCRSCRGSGVLALVPVFELMHAPAGGSLCERGAEAADLRRRRVGAREDTLFLAALRKAAAGTVDVREPIRYLLHEQA